MSVHRSIQDLGYSLIRQRRHYIYRHPCGATVTVSKTASDHRAVKNILADAKRMLRIHGL